MNMTTNGYVVKGLFDDPQAYPRTFPFSRAVANYCGISRYTSWPLDSWPDKEMQKYSDDLMWKYMISMDLDFMALTVPSRQVLDEYVEKCEQLGIGTIILKIESTCAFPSATDDIPTEKCLGYEYIQNGYYSFLFHDLTQIRSELQKNSISLNENLLFDDVETTLR